MTTANYHRGLLSHFVERQRLRQAVQHIRPGDTVLDVACGEGGLVGLLPPDVDYMGLDILEPKIALARSRYPDQQFIVADLTQPLPKQAQKQYDVIVLLAFLEHVTGPAQILMSMAQYLRDDGHIVITTPAPWGSVVHAWGARLGLLSRHAAQEHERFLGRHDLERIAQDAQLTMVEYRRFLYGVNQLARYSR